MFTLQFAFACFDVYINYYAKQFVSSVLHSYLPPLLFSISISCLLMFTLVASEKYDTFFLEKMLQFKDCCSLHCLLNLQQSLFTNSMQHLAMLIQVLSTTEIVWRRQ